MDYYRINDRKYIKRETKKDEFCKSGYGTTYQQIRFVDGEMEILKLTTILDSKERPYMVGEELDSAFERLRESKFSVGQTVSVNAREYTIVNIKISRRGYHHTVELSDGTIIPESRIDSPPQTRYVVKRLVTDADGELKIKKERHFVPDTFEGKVTEHIAHKLSVDVEEIEVSESR